MVRYFLTVVALLFAVHPLSADDDKESHFTLGKDAYLAGTTVVHDRAGVDDLFMAGNNVRSNQAISGSLHLAGRKIHAVGAVGGDAYVAGFDISLTGKVAGDVTASGYYVTIGEVGGNLRVSGADVTLAGPVSGYALVSGDDVTIEGIINGDLMLSAEDVEFSESARIDGKLILYEEEAGDISVPPGLVPEDRIERRDIAELSEAAADLELWDWRDAFIELLEWVLIITVVAALIASFAPNKLGDLRRNILAKPSRSLLFGFLTLSALVGAAIVLIVTGFGIGVLFALISLVVALLVAFAGYVVGAYAVGVWLLMLVRKREPDNFAARVLAAVMGVLVVALIALIPILGWLFVMFVALIGAGSISILLFRPAFFATT